jgi:hypothetical protein
MADIHPTHPTERAVSAARRRKVRNSARRERIVWGLVLAIIVLFVASIVILSSRSTAPQMPSDEFASNLSEQLDDSSTTKNVAAVKAPVPINEQSAAANEPKPPAKRRRKPVESITIRLENRPEPVVPPQKPELAPALPKPASKPAMKSVREIKPIDAEFLSTPLPAVALGAVAPARPTVLLEFPSIPEDLQLRVWGLEQLNEMLASGKEGSTKLAATYSDSKETLVIRNESSNEEVATFFLQKRELRFRWKPRKSLAEIQQRLRDYCVLQVIWKGHPGRYYALHDLHARGPRRIREQQVRLRASELPTNIDSRNLFIGNGKLELADVYSHRFLLTGRSQRVEVPTLKQAHKDPTLFVSLTWEENSLVFQLDAPINDERDARRRRKLFAHVDGNFYLHASLYRVVDEKIKVEVMRLGTPD